MHRVLALDIGGANLKAACADAETHSAPFEVWRRPRELSDAIANLIGHVGPWDGVAVTMTAELCDCFETKSDGVNAVLNAVETALISRGRMVPIRVWLSDGRIVALDVARSEPLLAAAANWLATATWAGRLCPRGNALVIDVGSTTTDIIPLRDGVAVPTGRTDRERLATGELVYSGIRRTPVFALLPFLTIAGHATRLATELFATTEDVYVWRGELDERPTGSDTADGRPATRPNAAARLARTICADRTMLSDNTLDEMASQFATAQLTLVTAAAKQVADRIGRQLKTIIVAGSGEFLAQHVAARLGFEPGEIISVGDRFGVAVSTAAPAFALAVLASEHGLE